MGEGAEKHLVCYSYSYHMSFRVYIASTCTGHLEQLNMMSSDVEMFEKLDRKRSIADAKRLIYVKNQQQPALLNCTI